MTNVTYSNLGGWEAPQGNAATPEPASGSLQPSACHECKRDTSGEMTWLGEAGHEICQECWEQETSRSWWKMVEELNRLGLLEAP